jgi:hypothetical protein
MLMGLAVEGLATVDAIRRRATVTCVSRMHDVGWAIVPAIIGAACGRQGVRDRARHHLGDDEQ